MEGTVLKCAECHVEMTATDLEFAVPTDAGPVHRECFEGPLPPGMAIDEDTALDLTAAEIEAENEHRERVGDPPIDTRMLGARCVEGDHDLCRAERCDCGCHRDTDDGLDRRDPEDDRSLQEQRGDDENFARYSEEGRTY